MTEQLLTQPHHMNSFMFHSKSYEMRCKHLQVVLVTKYHSKYQTEKNEEGQKRQVYVSCLSLTHEHD